MNNKIIPIRTCKDCANCIITPDKDLYECWFEDYFYKVDPNNTACESFRDRKVEEKRHLDYLKKNMPELLDENGQQWKDPYVLLEKMSEVATRLEKNKKVIDMPPKPKMMPDHIYEPYKETAKLMAELWGLCVEKNPIKLKNFAINKLNPDNWIHAELKNFLYMLGKGKDLDDILIEVICAGEEKANSERDIVVYSLIRKFFHYLRYTQNYHEFEKTITSSVPEDKKNDFLTYIKGGKNK